MGAKTNPILGARATHAWEHPRSILSGMPKSSRRILAENLNALMSAHPEIGTEKALRLRSGLGGGTIAIIVSPDAGGSTRILECSAFLRQTGRACFTTFWSPRTWVDKPHERVLQSRRASSTEGPMQTTTQDTGGAPRYLAARRCPRCSHTECTVVCTRCAAFKVARAVAPFAHELEADERRAA
jgi:hypothetical protein